MKPYKHYKLSVVCPVYNVSDYIVECCESLFGQTLEGIEYIFVNDQTPDDSIAKIKATIDRYPERKGDVTIIDNAQNIGCSLSRQAGVRAATGEYVAMVDSDDVLEPTMYAEMYHKASTEALDMVVCDLCSFDRVNEDIIYRHNISSTHDALIKAHLKFTSNGIAGSLGTKIIRRNIFINHNISFPNNHFIEDRVTSFECIAHAKKVGYIPTPFYRYRQRPNSAMNQAIDVQKILKRRSDAKTNIGTIEQYLNTTVQSKELRDYIIYSKLYVFNLHADMLLDTAAGRTEMLNTYPGILREVILNKALPLTYKLGFIKRWLSIYRHK